MNDIHRMLIQLFDNAGVTYRSSHQIQAYPPTNWIKTSPNTYLLQLALAGFKREELEVSLDGRILMIKGQKSDETEEQNQWSYAQHGIAVRSFAKAVKLDRDIELDKVIFEDGLLSLHMKRKEPEVKEPVKIAIG